MKVQRLGNGPLIDSHTAGYNAEIHNNINGPSLIRVPDWVQNPLGRYYLYFAHHNGDHIRMAYANSIDGPYRILGGGVLNLDESRFIDHIASPDVHVDHAKQQIRMYYHGVLTDEEQKHVVPEIDEIFFYKQRTRVAISSDGLNFEEQPQIISSAYLRVIEFDGAYYGITMPGLLYRSHDGLTNFERGPLLFGDDGNREGHFFVDGQINPRHFAIQKRGDTLHLYFSLVPGTPESIYTAEIVITADWHKCTVGESQKILSPEKDYEGVSLPLETSARGWVPNPVRELRDPAIFEEGQHTYLFYSTQGEQGIALAEMFFG